MSRELAVASALLFEEQPSADLNGVDEPALVSLLCRNRVPVAVLPRAREFADLGPTHPLAACLAAQTERLERNLAAYSDVATAWAAEGIDAVLIKSSGYFPYTSSNVDVLVARERAGDACLILEGCGFGELELAREPYKRLFRKLNQPYLGFPIHLHTDVAWINRFLDGGEVLATLRRSKELPLLAYPSPDDVVLITTAHWLYEDKELTLRDLDQVSRAVLDGADWTAVRRRSERGGWRSGLELALGVYGVAARKVGARRLAANLPNVQLSPTTRRSVERASCQPVPPIRVPKLLSKALQVRKSLGNPELRRLARVSEAFDVLYYAARAKLPSIRRGPPLVVGVSGPDGAGKTTLARALEEFLKDEIGVSVAYRWRRVGTSPALDAARRLAASFVRLAAGRGGRHGPDAPLKEQLRGHTVLRRAWAHVLAAEFLGRAWADHARSRATGGVHIFDRGPIDAEVDLAAMYSTDARWLAAFAPRPAVQLLVVPDSNGAESAYLRFERDASAVLSARYPLEGLVERSAREVLSAYIAAGRTT